MRPLRASLFVLALFALAPVGDAATTRVFTHTFDFDGNTVARETDVAFTMVDPGGLAPVACYHRIEYRDPQTTGNVGVVTIRVLDDAGNVAFVDGFTAEQVVVVTLIPVGVAGFATGTWHVVVDANGRWFSQHALVWIDVSDTGSCPS